MTKDETKGTNPVQTKIKMARFERSKLSLKLTLQRQTINNIEISNNGARYDLMNSGLHFVYRQNRTSGAKQSEALP